MKKIDFNPYVVKTGTPILAALETVNIHPLYVALIVDSENKLIGMLTDGDFRRGLLAGHQLENKVDVFMHKDPITARETIRQDEADEIMKIKKLECLPLVDENGILKAILKPGLSLDEKSRFRTAIIMAGGRGSRLYPLTQNCPKPMLRINNKPILEILIEQCMKAGFEDFYISVNYLKEKIIDYFGNGEKFGINIQYIIEDKPLGTAGSLQLLPKTLDEPFLVLNGDLLTKFDYRNVMQFHASHRPLATMCVREHVMQVPYGVVKTDGHKLIGMEEKPIYRQFVNAGLYVLDPSILEYLEVDKPTDMPTLLSEAHSKNCQILVCPIHEYWRDIGRPETLDTAKLEWDANLEE